MPDKRAGVNDSEQYLSRLCSRTFLSLWSHPNVQKGTSPPKEVCDLLVVFDNHIIIFSDKNYSFQDTGDLQKDWDRWYRKSVTQSAKQVYGAERWIRRNPEKLFLDPKGEEEFPIELPNISDAIFHRIIVVHNSASIVEKKYGQMGSLPVFGKQFMDAAKMDLPSEEDVSHLPEEVRQLMNAPYIGIHDTGDAGYIHVLDDVSLDLVLNHLDTVSDFVEYLTEKESFVRDARFLQACGEEDLLGYYLKSDSLDGKPHFPIPNGADAIVVDGSMWIGLESDSGFRAELKARESSRLWDNLIEDCVKLSSPHKVPLPITQTDDLEFSFRNMARESRLNRRALSTEIQKLFNGNDVEAKGVVNLQGNTSYVFVRLPVEHIEHYDTDSEFYTIYLSARCMAFKARNPVVQDVCGLLLTGTARKQILRFVLNIDGQKWTNEDQEAGLKASEDLDMFQNPQEKLLSVEKYPEVEGIAEDGSIIASRKGRDANKPCPCGSGKKIKKCCGSRSN